jgi:uncharacterized protein
MFIHRTFGKNYVMISSAYNIYVSLNNNPDYFFAVQGYTGALDLIKSDVVQHLRHHTIDKINSNTIQSLFKRGYVTDRTANEEQMYVKSLANIIQKRNRKQITSSFLFLVSYDCNFRCAYCFENNYKEKSWPKLAFTKEMVDKAYKTMLEIEPNRGKHADSIILYGGEPLLSENYAIVKYIIEEGRKRDYTFRAITNGYDLHTYLDLLGRRKIQSLQITVDGLEETHDSRRIHYRYTKSFRKIIDNIDAALSTGVNIEVRMNGDKTNYGDIEKLVTFFTEKGWFDMKNFSFCPATTYRENTTIEEKQRSYTRAEFIKKVTELKEFSQNKIQDITSIGHHLNDSIQNNKFFPLKVAFCGAFQGMNILDPIGNIYPCWEVVGLKDHIIANYKKGLVYTQENKKWQNRTIMNMERCTRCKYALICTGGCAGRLAASGKDIYKACCENFDEVFAIMVNIYYRNSSISI